MTIPLVDIIRIKPAPEDHESNFKKVDAVHGFTLLVGIDFDFKLKALGFG